MVDGIKISIKSELKVLTGGIRLAVVPVESVRYGYAGDASSTDVAISLGNRFSPGLCIDQAIKLDWGCSWTVCVKAISCYRVLEELASKISLVVYDLFKRVRKVSKRVLPGLCRRSANKPLRHSVRLSLGGCLRL